MIKQCLLAASLSVPFCPASAQERVHSDLPLFSGAKEEIWPRGVVDKGSWGCSSRVAFGDWKYVQPRRNGADPLIEWLRLANYGVFHCAAVESWAEDREEQGRRGFKHSWFVQLGLMKHGGSPIEFWVLQSGVRPGSDYLLLTRAPGPGLIKSFEVLEVDCPRENQRKGEGPDIWRTDYCAINSAAELRTFARRMANRAPVATLTFVAEAPENTEPNSD